MPTYDYACHKCGLTFEVHQSFDQAPLRRHRGGCGGKVVRVLAPVGIAFKGSGFYKTDNSDSRRKRQGAPVASDTDSATTGSDATSATGTGADVQGPATKGSDTPGGTSGKGSGSSDSQGSGSSGSKGSGSGSKVAGAGSR